MVPWMTVAGVQAPGGRLRSAVLPGIKTCLAEMRLRSAYRRFAGPLEATMAKCDLKLYGLQLRSRSLPQPRGPMVLHDSPLEGGGFEPSVPRLRWSSVQLAADDATDAAIAKPGNPIVRVAERRRDFADGWLAT